MASFLQRFALGGKSLWCAPTPIHSWHGGLVGTDDYVVRKYMLVRYNESTMRTETLNPSVFLDVGTGDHGLDGISLLDPDGAQPFSGCGAHDGRPLTHHVDAGIPTHFGTQTGSGSLRYEKCPEHHPHSIHPCVHCSWCFG